MAGLGGASIEIHGDDAPVIIEEITPEGDKKIFDDEGNVVRIEHANGDISLNSDGSPIEKKKRTNVKWFGNLVEDIDDDELGRIADDLIRGISDDEESRRDWLEQRAKGIRLLGLKIEDPTTTGADGAPLDGMSRVRHPLLQEAVIRFQANARAEMLPTDGPAKIRDDSTDGTTQRDQIADDFEKDLNHYLTTTASEFYPDTDRMLLMLGFGGLGFKKIYKCPLRNRPVSEHVDAEDLIVNDSATDLKNSQRVTHRIFMRKSTIRRMQILGVYRDIELSAPQIATQNSVDKEKLEQQGIRESQSRPEDRERELYECYCELNIKGFEHKFGGKESGLEIPYRVTIDVSTQQILAITRNFDKPEEVEDDPASMLPESNVTFVKYEFIPGFGFYGIGLLHILGNTTQAITAGWRELLDMGMFSNFPGFLISEDAARQNTNVFRIPPGGSQKVKVNGPISESVMPLPYNMQAAPAFMQLIENMFETGQRVGGTAELPTGEGKADAPVGTTLAIIDGATKILNSVHKRMHAAQAEELQLLVKCFRDNPKSFWQRNKKPSRPWDEQTFLKAVDDFDLVPQSDPNTSSQLQRLVKLGALLMLAMQMPNLYDMIALHKAAIRGLGYSNPDEFMAPPSAMAQPTPEVQKMQQETQAKVQDAQTKATLAQAKVAEGKGKLALDQAKLQHEMSKGGEGGAGPVDYMKAKAGLIEAHARAKEVDAKQAESAVNAHNLEADRASKEQLAVLDLAKDVAMQQHDHAHDMAKHQSGLSFDGEQKGLERAATTASEGAKMSFEGEQKGLERETKLESEKAKAKAKPAAPKGKK